MTTMLKKGKYRNNIKFSEYAVSKFSPHIYAAPYNAFGCGPTALGLITGVEPHKIKSRRTYSDKFMADFLRGCGYTVLPVTKEDVSQTPLFIVSHIKDHHVVLVSQMAIRGQATWSTVFGGNVFHNFQVSPLDPLEFLNRPLLSAHLVFHKKWV